MKNIKYPVKTSITKALAVTEYCMCDMCDWHLGRHLIKTLGQNGWLPIMLGNENVPGQA